MLLFPSLLDAPPVCHAIFFLQVSFPIGASCLPAGLLIPHTTAQKRTVFQKAVTGDTYIELQEFISPTLLGFES